MAPFMLSGATNMVDWTALKLQEHGHRVEKILLPGNDEPSALLRQMCAYRWIEISESADLVITFRPPAHFIRHPNKKVWFIHHIRRFYDLWDSQYRGFPDNEEHRSIRHLLMESDTTALSEAKRVYTNSNVVKERLRTFNNVDSEVLYPPVYDPSQFHFDCLGDEIVMICRKEHHKRQHLLIEAMAYVKTPVRLRLCGESSDKKYLSFLHRVARRHSVGDKVVLEDAWIPEERKAQLLASCLAAAYLPLDEDSYGYPTLEAAHSEKVVITTTDSGGVLEFIKDGESGLVVEPDPRALAEALDRLYTNREETRRMGLHAKERIASLNISWDHVIDRLTS